MSNPLVVTVSHSLGKEEALRRIKSGLARAGANVPLVAIEEEVWSGDRMAFRVRAMGQTAAGTLDVAEDNIRFEVTLPWVLQRFGELIQGAVKARGQVLLEKK